MQRAYHVPDGFPGVAKRVSFLVGPDGKIARVWPDVDPGVHAGDVLGTIDALKGEQRGGGQRRRRRRDTCHLSSR